MLDSWRSIFQYQNFGTWRFLVGKATDLQGKMTDLCSDHVRLWCCKHRSLAHSGTRVGPSGRFDRR